MNMGRLSVVTVIALSVAQGIAYAQLPPYRPGQELVDASFEVASVRENRLSRREAIRSPIRLLPSGQFEARYALLKPLMMMIYGLRHYQIVNAPEWVENERFDIVAKAPEGAEPAHVRAMARKLLEDRFGLVAHREKRRMPTYSLTWVDDRRRPSPGLRPPSGSCDKPEVSTTVSAPSGLAVGTASPECEHAVGFGIGWIFLRRNSISSFLPFLIEEVGRVVVDETGLTGLYDLDLKWSPEVRPGSAVPPALVPDVAGGVSIFTAIQEQLGLKLEPSSGEVEVLVIDRLDRPTPD
jgi:uncharacterized protein (TIGR03435 family)